jgi:hypothetical protein
MRVGGHWRARKRKKANVVPIAGPPKKPDPGTAIWAFHRASSASAIARSLMFVSDWNAGMHVLEYKG